MTLVDGSVPHVDSSEMAFKIAGSMAFKKAFAEADPVLLEPIMSSRSPCPTRPSATCIGDLNSRRGRLLGMDPARRQTTIHAEVPMAEMLAYAPDLTSMTGGRGDYAMRFAPLRGGAGARRAEADRRGEEGEGGGQSLKSPHMGVSTYSRGVVRARPAVTARSAAARSSSASAPSASRPTGGSSSTSARSARTRRCATAGLRSEGGPSLPVHAGERQSRSLFGRLWAAARRPSSSIPEPILRQLSRGEQAIVEAATLFNLSPHRRTVEGLTRSLGWPTVSIVALSGTNPEVVITVCWEISWYQYRVVLGTSQVRLAQRGLEPDDLDEPFRDWNAELNDAGLVVPRLAEEE